MPNIQVRQTISNPKPNFEDVLQSSGGFGRFQLFVLVGLLFAEIPAAFVTFSPVFVGRSQSMWICDNVTLTSSDVCECTGSLKLIPEYSIVTEWGLVCESSWVSDFITSIQMLGMLLGSLFSSQISDWYGRKYVYLGVCILMASGQFLSALATNPILYALSRFIAGAGISGFMGMSTIYPLEFMTSEWRVLIGSVGPWGEGIMLFALLGYWIQPWRELLLVSCLPFALLIFILPFIPESPRWYLRQGKITEAQQVLKVIQKVNGKSDINITRELLEEIRKEENAGVTTSRMSYLDFFREDVLRKKTLILMGIWFAWSLVYFGISYNITSLPGNIYFNVFLMGLSDALGYPAALLINNKLGRRKSLVIFMSLGAVFLVTLALLDVLFGKNGVNPVIIIFLCLSGKFGMAGARSAARVLTGESFPTNIRTMGYGISGVTAGIAGIIAPQISYFGAQWWSPLPFVTFGAMSVGGSLLSLLLPETAGKGLEERMINRPVKNYLSNSNRPTFAIP